MLMPMSKDHVEVAATREHLLRLVWFWPRIQAILRDLPSPLRLAGTGGMVRKAPERHLPILTAQWHGAQASLHASHQLCSMGRSDKGGEPQFHLHQSPPTRAWPHPSNLRCEAMPGQMRSCKTR